MNYNGKMNKNRLPKPKEERTRRRQKVRKEHKSDRQRKVNDK